MEDEQKERIRREIEGFFSLDLYYSLIYSMKIRQFDEKIAEKFLEEVKISRPIYDISNYNLDSIFSITEVPYRIQSYCEIYRRYGSSIVGDMDTESTIRKIYKLAQDVHNILESHFVAARDIS